MSHINKLFKKVRSFGSAHKVWSAVILVVIIALIYWIYILIRGSGNVTQYVITPAHIGTLTQTVTGSSQVTAQNQIDIKSEVSGTILSINAKVGDSVHTGDLIATVDSHDARIDLENARISYAKLTQPAKATDLSNAKDNLNKSYSDAFNAVSSAYIDLPNVMAGLKDLFYSQSGFLSDQDSTSLIASARVYRDTASLSYDRAVDQYKITIEEYKSLTRSSATSSLDKLIADTYTTVNQVANVLKNTQNAITYITTAQSEYNSSGAVSAASNVNTWSNTINSDLASIVSTQNSIKSNSNSLTTLVDGADNLDIQSSKLSLDQKQSAYSKYFIRAPFDGVVGRIPVNVYDQAGNGTVMATIVSNKKITTIPLNEVDAVKVKTNNDALLTFDAIEGLSVRGTVVEVDLVGTASQGVVTYNVKIAFDADDIRIRPGMSTDATIVTEEKPGVLLVPSSAVKAQGRTNYVEVLNGVAANPNFTNQRNASSTSMSSTTRTFGTTNNIVRGQQTITSPTPPIKVTVVIGDTNDTDTEIVSGLDAGQFVVVRTITGAAAVSQSSTPNLFGNLTGGQRNVTRPATGATRTTTGTTVR